jgi:FtsP/CotA-like multicopper oxidase with cupredoxin domain
MTHDERIPPANGDSPMTPWHQRPYTRRRFLRLGGAALAATAGASLIRAFGGDFLGQVSGVKGAAEVNLHLAASDGWITLPGIVGGVHPDPWAPEIPGALAPPAPQTFSTWVLGFHDVTGLDQQDMERQRMQVQNPAPVLWVDEHTTADPHRVNITLTNLGLQIRPDLTDSHTIHWHGFRNAIPLYDGVPELSIAVPTGRDFTYVYEPRFPGTYMYHCHFEDVEHVSMGMTGIIFVRPKQNRAPINPGELYAYNDADFGMPGVSRYDREYPIFLSEMWAQEHFDGAHIQEHDWSEYEPDFWLMNGRCFPETLLPNGSQDANGDLVAPPGAPHLLYQPYSSLIEGRVGERILLRLVNLGFQQASMTLEGMPMKVVGKDASLLAGRAAPGASADITYLTDTVHIGPGESYDVIIEATHPGTYLFYNRQFAKLHNPGVSGNGGQMTHVVITP